MICTDHYADKIEMLKDIFRVQNVFIEAGCLTVGNKTYPIIDDVIVLCEQEQYTGFVKDELNQRSKAVSDNQSQFAQDIQFTFGKEWKLHNLTCDSL